MLFGQSRKSINLKYVQTGRMLTLKVWMDMSHSLYNLFVQITLILKKTPREWSTLHHFVLC